MYVHILCLAAYVCFIAIEVSVKPASSSQMTTKKVTLNLTGAIPAAESVENMSNTGRKTVNVCAYSTAQF